VISKDTKNIIKGFALAAVVFGTIYFFSTIGKKKKLEESDKGTADNNGNKNDKAEEAVIVVNPEPIAEDLTPNVDAFAHADGTKKEESMPRSLDAQNALNWFEKEGYRMDDIKKEVDEIVIKRAKALGWDGG